jgi:hypothetical protein
MNGQITVIGSRTDANDYRYQLDITPEGAIPISGVLSTSSSGTVYTGSVIPIDSLPTDSNMNNASWSFEYDADGNVGSIYQMIGTGSYISTLTWVGFSGTTAGTGSRVTNVSDWSVV